MVNEAEVMAGWLAGECVKVGGGCWGSVYNGWMGEGGGIIISLTHTQKKKKKGMKDPSEWTRQEE